MAGQTRSRDRFSEVQHRLIRLGGFLLGLLGLILFFIGGALLVLGLGLVWRMRRQ